MLPLLYEMIGRKNRNGSRRMYIITTGNGKYIHVSDFMGCHQIAHIN